MPLAEVKAIYETNSTDIPAMLRKLAGEIESGEQPARYVGCIVREGEDSMRLYGWGKITVEESAVMFLKAGQMLVYQSGPVWKS